MNHGLSDDNKVTYFAETDSRNRRMRFGIKRKDRSRHMYVIGKTGMGKSTLLENMAIQDIQNGEGMAFVDPHGKTAELLLEYVPEERIKDVVYFAPFDMEYPVAFNIMEDVGPDKRHLVVNGLMSTFEKIWVDAWSARMAYILSNTLLALLEFPNATLLSVNRMLADKEYRKLVVDNVTDPSVKSFWIDEFGKYTERFAAEATPAIQNKIGQFTSNPLIRNIIGQPKSSFDIRKMMDERKILIVNLSKGRVGEGNANLLGSMMITKIYLAAMSRADASEDELKKLPNFYLHVDEFQSFANKSFADILSEARKYKLGLIMAHQYIEQMEEEVRAAVFGNVGTMTVFRVGAFDAAVLEKEFAPQFTAEDLVNLGIFQVYLKLMIDGVSSRPFSAVTMPPIPKPERIYKDAVIEASRKQFAHPRAYVEEEIQKWHTPIVPEKKPSAGKTGVASGSGVIKEGRDNTVFIPAVEPKKSQNLSHQEEKRADGNMVKNTNTGSNSGTHSLGSATGPDGKQRDTKGFVQSSHVGQRNGSGVEAHKKQDHQGKSKEHKPFLSALSTIKEGDQIEPAHRITAAVPLSSLVVTPGKKDGKARSPENVSALKAALASVLKDRDQSIQSIQSQNTRQDSKGNSPEAENLSSQNKANKEKGEDATLGTIYSAHQASSIKLSTIPSAPTSATSDIPLSQVNPGPSEEEVIKILKGER